MFIIFECDSNDTIIVQFTWIVFYESITSQSVRKVTPNPVQSIAFQRPTIAPTRHMEESELRARQNELANTILNALLSLFV